MEETQLKPTAYHKWLMQLSKGDKDIIVHLLQRDLLQQNGQTFDLLESTGHQNFKKETFELAADILIEICTD